MRKRKKYLDIDVYQAAKQRINHILDIFDKVYVSFSGGKDSLAVLKLLEEVYRDRGFEKKINVIFRDEELIQDDVIDFVSSFMDNPLYDLRYYAVQQQSQKYILGRVFTYRQWDPSRKWIRPKPSFAITDPSDRVHTQNTMDGFLFKGVKGKIAFLNGIRADESLTRFSSCFGKKTDNYINLSSVPNVKFCKPIYDWTEKDVFRFFYEKNIKYCVTYDVQALAGKSLRVATPLLAESAKQFDKLKRMYPTFYEQIISIFPEMLLQERYYSQFDREAIFYQYPHTFDGIIQYIRENFTDRRQRDKAISYVRTAQRIRRKRGDRDNLGGYPVLHVFKHIVSGNKQMVQPKIEASKKDFEYEKMKEIGT